MELVQELLQVSASVGNSTSSGEDHGESRAVGYVAVVISILFFGSFALPMKSKRVQEANVDPVVFQLYYSTAIFITSWLACIKEPFAFHPVGIYSAMLWVPASILSIFAINHIGLSVAQGLWSGVTIVVSFIWGQIIPPVDKVEPVLAAFSMISLISGSILISFCKNRFFFKGPIQTPGQMDASPLLNEDQTENKKSTVVGVACAVVLGVLNGSMLVPTKLITTNSYQFMPNFGIGVVVVTPVCAVIYFGLKRQMPDLKLKHTAPYGLTSGVLWNVGNVGSVIAVGSLGLSIGFPLTQLALLVAGLWGMMLFKEFPFTMQQIQFFISAGVLLLGALFLLLAANVNKI